MSYRKTMIIVAAVWLCSALVMTGLAHMTMLHALGVMVAYTAIFGLVAVAGLFRLVSSEGAVRWRGWTLQSAIGAEGDKVLCIDRRGRPGRIRLVAHQEGVIATIMNSDATSMLNYALSTYQDLRTPLRLATAQTVLSAAPPQSQPMMHRGTSLTVGEWVLRKGELLDGDVRRQCLEVRYRGRPGKILVCSDDAGVLVHLCKHEDPKPVAQARAPADLLINGPLTL